MEMQRAIAAKIGSSEPVFVDVPRPEAPGDGEVLCRTLQLGICGTDREILASKQPWVPDGEDYLVLGHECLARVEAVGLGVTGFVPGDLVVPTVRRPLRDSNIRIDMLSFGDYTERGIVKQHGFSQPLWLERPEFLLPIEEELADIAVFAEPQSVAEKAVNEALLLQQSRLGQDVWSDPPPRVLVTGQGPIAFAALIACSARGWPVTMMGRDRGTTCRISLASNLGAESYVPLEEADLNLANHQRDGYDLLLESTGSDEVLLESSLAVAPRGVAVWLGASREPRSRPHNVSRLMRHAILRNHLHLGTVNSAERDFQDALQHLRQLRQRLPEVVSRIVTDKVGLDWSLVEFTGRQVQSVKVVVSYD